MGFFRPPIYLSPRSHAAAYDLQSTGEVPHSVLGSKWWGVEALKGLFWVFPKMVGKPLKWMVKIMENPIEMDDLGGTTISGNIYIVLLNPIWKGFD